MINVTFTCATRGDLLQELKDFLGETVTPVEPVTEAPKTKAAKKKVEAPVEEPKKEEAPQYTLEEVRARMGHLVKTGHRDKVKKILDAVGAEVLTEVDPADFGRVMEMAGEIDA